MKKYLRGVAAALALATIVPATASADWEAEYQAGNRAEQKLAKRYPGYNVYGFCDQQGRRFWCTVGGSKGDCYVSGHAWVRRSPWRVSFVGVNRTCI